VDRWAPLVPPENIWILTNDYVRGEIVKQLPEVPKKQIIAEPAQRNTAPAIGLAAHILHSIDKDAALRCIPSDHAIGDSKGYVKALKPAFKAAAAGKIALLGIQPRWPETGYGYVRISQGYAGGHGWRGGSIAIPREAGSGECEEIRKGGQLLLECRNVLLEGRDRAGRDAHALAEDGDSVGKSARVFFAEVRAEAR
jgi:mannose-1-phosphate guanylyltransferase